MPERTAETLRELRRRGYRLGLASSSKNAGVILTRTGLDALLDRVVDGNQITRSKPDPEVFLRAAQLLKLPPEDCAGVDDALAGVESARTAGMTAAAIGPAALAGAGDWNLECLSRLLDLCPPLEGGGTCDPAHRLRHRWDPAPGDTAGDQPCCIPGGGPSGETGGPLLPGQRAAVPQPAGGCSPP